MSKNPEIVGARPSIKISKEIPVFWRVPAAAALMYVSSHAPIGAINRYFDTLNIASAAVLAEDPTCEVGFRLTLRDYKDVNGNGKHDEGDLDGDPIKGAKLKFSVNAKDVMVIVGSGVDALNADSVTTDTKGMTEFTMPPIPCNTDGKSLTAVADITTTDGREVIRNIAANNGRKQTAIVWVPEKVPAIVPAPTAELNQLRAENQSLQNQAKVKDEALASAETRARAEADARTRLQAEYDNQKRLKEADERVINELSAKIGPVTSRGWFANMLASIGDGVEWMADMPGKILTLSASAPEDLPAWRKIVDGLFVGGVLATFIANRPFRYRSRVVNTVAWPLRRTDYAMEMRAHRRAVAAAIVAATTPPPPPVPPPSPFSPI